MTTPRRGNLLEAFSDRLPDEEFTELLSTKNLRLERIVSLGHTTAAGEWYDQEMDEWVVVIRGRARLRLAEPDEILEMKPGDWIHLPAHRRHRVEWTDPEEPTVWLAVHFDA